MSESTILDKKTRDFVNRLNKQDLEIKKLKAQLNKAIDRTVTTTSTSTSSNPTAPATQHNLPQLSWTGASCRRNSVTLSKSLRKLASI